jgi:hypothetical protein
MSDIRRPRAARPTVSTLALAALLAGCGGGGGSTTHDSPDGQTFVGTLADGAALSLTFGASPAPAVQQGQALALAASDTIPVTGTITPSGSSPIPVTGTYDLATGEFSITGGNYTLTGTYSRGVLTGTGTGPGGSITFAAASTAAGAPTRFCGTYSGAEDGQMMLIVSGSTALLTVSATDQAFMGTVSGASVTVTYAPKGVTVNGTIAGGSVGGTWTASGGSGTWSATTAACSG